MTLLITAMTTAFIVPLYIWLAFRVINFRKRSKISFGDGEDQDMLRRVRAHGNCAEYAPFGVLLLALNELSGTPTLILCGLALLLVAGRVCHAYSFVHVPMNYNARTAGMALTFAMLALSALCLLIVNIV